LIQAGLLFELPLGSLLFHLMSSLKPIT
jgi:hypothetical protein